MPTAMRFMALVLLVLACAPVAHARERAPGAPGDRARWGKVDKDGLGTSASEASRVWFTLRGAGMAEVFYPDLRHPSARALELMVDGKPVTAGDVTNDGLVYTQTSETRAWRLIRTTVTDPERATVLIKVRFESKDGADHDVEVEFDPQLYGDGDDDVGWTRGHALLAHDRHIASALVAQPSLTRTSSGYKGRDESTLLEHTYDALRPGNVIQQAHTRLTGRGEGRDLTLALGFAQVGSQALQVARDTLGQGWDATAAAYRDGWLAYRNTLFPIPAAALPVSAAYETSVLLLKALEDKDRPGAFVTSPNPNRGVRARDLYHVATALLAAGDKAGANRALDVLLDQRPEGLTIVLAHQLGRTERADWPALRRAADAILAGKAGEEAAARIAGLICAADVARKRGDAPRAARYERRADAWQRAVKPTPETAVELVRLGVRRADDPAVVRVLPDTATDTPVRKGARGELELLAGRPANPFLAEMVSAAGSGIMLSEKRSGAAPFAWSHAQLIRLAWSIETRTPVEFPVIVGNRYG